MICLICGEEMEIDDNCDPYHVDDYGRPDTQRDNHHQAVEDNRCEQCGKPAPFCKCDPENT
jgi:DNA-directed RNA polymerase subunit RPC12/RpoP